VIVVVRLGSVALQAAIAATVVRQALDSALEQIMPFQVDRWAIACGVRVLIGEYQKLAILCSSSVLLLDTRA
jgi:hypothetical protein